MSDHLGDRGQRYEVFARDSSDKRVSIGWTNAKDGGSLVASINAHPSWHSPEVVDRFPGIEKIIHVSRFKAGCRKCIEEVFGGKDHCRYCQTLFPLVKEHGRVS